MAMETLGEQIDIDGGGADLIFPHHENEIAQSESLSGKPFARYWVHTGLLHMGEEKMAHSGIFVTVSSALEVTPAPAFRLYLLSQSYRTPFTYLPEQVGAAVKRWHRWVEARQAAARFVGDTPAPEREPEEFTHYRGEFLAAMDDDSTRPPVWQSSIRLCGVSTKSPTNQCQGKNESSANRHVPGWLCSMS